MPAQQRGCADENLRFEHNLFPATCVARRQASGSLSLRGEGWGEGALASECRRNKEAALMKTCVLNTICFPRHASRVDKLPAPSPSGERVGVRGRSLANAGATKRLR